MSHNDKQFATVFVAVLGALAVSPLVLLDVDGEARNRIVEADHRVPHDRGPAPVRTALPICVAICRLLIFTSRIICGRM